MYKIGSMPSSIQIGFVGETNFRTIEIDMTAWMEKMPAGIPSIIHVRPGETKAQAYIAATDFDEETNVLSWPITAGDIGILEGEGEMQVWLEETADEETTKRGKSVKVITVVNDSANEPDATPPEAQAAYMEQMTALKMATVEAAEDAADAKADAETAQAAAEQAATDAENVNLHPAYIDSTTKHWMVYDATQHQYTDTQILAEGQDATPDLVCLPYEDLTFPVSKGTLCYHGSDLCKAKQDISTSEAWTAAHWDVTNIDAEMSLLKTAIQGKPDEKNSTATNVDLDITDDDGNVIARFSNGNFSVKKFDSAKAPSTSAVDTDSNSDFVIADPAGNVVLMIHNGNIETKNFKSVSIKPNIITVKKNGQGDFTNLRDAVESITDADPISNPYVIEIYEGVYNVLDDYTTEEIESAGEAHYTDTSFVGIKITDGISLKGIGCRDNIVLYGYLDPSEYTTANRNNIATINTQGECALENLTIVGENIRYAVHDDFSDNFRTLNGRNPKRIIKDCVFVAKNTTGLAAYGAGTSKARDYFFDNCLFIGGGCGIHKATSMPNSGTMRFENCGGYGLSIGDYSTSATDAVHLLILNNCDFDTISIYKSNNGSYNGQHIKIIGASKEDCPINVPDGFVYQFGNVLVTEEQLNAGDAVDETLQAVSEKIELYGVCIGSKDGKSYVQTSGYIKIALIGLTAVAGDYIGLSNGSLAVVSTPSDAIGLIVEYNSTLYMRMLH